MNILLILGGWSSERDVSLNSGAAVEKTLVNLGHTVTRYDPQTSLEGLPAAAEKADFAFIALHGSPGEDGLIQAVLETTGCPYQGAGPSGSFLALNKAAAKGIFRHRGLPTPEWILLPKRPAKDWQPSFDYPIFIKSNTGGSSLGMERVAEPEDLEAALDRLFASGGEYIVEPSVSGVELTCGVLGCADGRMEALAPVMIRPKGNVATTFFDYTNKYAADGAEELCPAPLDATTTAAIQRLALAAHEALGLSDYSRTDFILKKDGSVVILETNTLPGMTDTSLLPKEAAAAGLTFAQLIERLVALGSSCPNKKRNRK